MKKSHQLSERLNYLDSAKGFSILLVVLAHISNQSIIGIDPLGIWINSFHLPLFFIVSGFLISYKNENEQPYVNLVYKKICTIIYPYLTFSILYLLYRTLICIVEIKFEFKEISSIILDTASLWGISTLWFLPTLFIGEIAFLLIVKIKNTLKIIFFILFSLVIGVAISIVFCRNIDNPSLSLKFLIIVSRSMFTILFISIGYYFYKFKIKYFDKIDSNFKLLLGILLFIINIFASIKPLSINLRIASIDNIPLYIFTGIIGSISIIILFEQFSLTNFFNYLGYNSLIIMATHLPFGMIDIIKNLFLFIAPTIVGSNYIYVFLICAIVICLELIIVKVITTYLIFLIKVPQQFKK
jgi:Fucose 4-O-acetylase and related acetyltransferases